MSNPNEHKSYDHEVRKESYKDVNGDTQSSVTRTTETVDNSKTTSNPNSYRDGYVHGQVSERRYQEEDLVERDNNTAARGLLIGTILTSLVGLVAGTLFFLNQRNEAPAPVTQPVVIPNAEPDAKSSPTANQAPEKETKIIEKTKVVPVPVPQQQPSPAPNFKISVPSPEPQQPAARQAPATQTAPSQPQSQSSTTPTPEISNQTDTATPTPEISNQTDTTTPTPETSNQTDTTTPTPETSSQTDTKSDSSSSPGQ